MLKDLGFEQKEPTVMYEDNGGCITFSQNPGTRDSTLHIDIRYHDLHGRVLVGTVLLVH